MRDWHKVNSDWNFKVVQKVTQPGGDNLILQAINIQMCLCNIIKSTRTVAL